MLPAKGYRKGGVLSPLLSNIMLHEFDSYLEDRYLSRKARAVLEQTLHLTLNMDRLGTVLSLHRPRSQGVLSH